ncbi:uncharacterized protein LOC113305630 [Papaver somniferum]|uniref:uncharacterized protein LOC113305630 n=1 Tax=Papaver somniferum TaxID=3469 RepID=UPI000E704B43|nr:uncharacterized protein LOC113305630 [Papaver somniferum]
MDTSHLGFHPRPNTTTVIEIISEWFNFDPNGFDLRLACHILWKIWKTRNECIIKKISPNPSSVNFCAYKLAQSYENPKDLEELMKISSIKNDEGCNTHWSKPSPGYYTINVDGAFLDSTYESAWEDVARDKLGHYQGCMSCFGHSFSPLEAEIKGFLLGLKLAKELGYQKVILEGDCLTAVHLIKGDINCFPRKIRGLLHDIQNQLSNFENVNVI